MTVSRPDRATDQPPPASNLLALARGRRARVVAVAGDDALAQRLADQGLWPGVEVQLLTVALGGDPLLFRLHGYRLALRRDEAARVLVALPDPEAGT